MKWNSISPIIKITDFCFEFIIIYAFSSISTVLFVSISVYKIAIMPTIINYVKAMNTISWIQGVFLEILKILEKEAFANI